MVCLLFVSFVFLVCVCLWFLIFLFVVCLRVFKEALVGLCLCVCTRLCFLLGVPIFVVLCSVFLLIRFLCCFIVLCIGRVVSLRCFMIVCLCCVLFVVVLLFLCGCVLGVY